MTPDTQFLDQEPTLIGRVAGYEFYEDPDDGDESPLWVVLPSHGTALITDWWELPEHNEFIEWLHT